MVFISVENRFSLIEPSLYFSRDFAGQALAGAGLGRRVNRLGIPSFFLAGFFWFWRLRPKLNKSPVLAKGRMFNIAA
jgi:hypothetical protein